MNWAVGKPIEIETERFYLRILTVDDVTEDYVSWWNDKDIQNGFGWGPRGYSLRDAKRHVSMFDNKSTFHFGIYDKGTDRLIGFFTLTFNNAHKVSTANICIGDKALWNKGAANEVLLASVKFRFEEMGVEKLEGKVNGRNHASMALFEKLGFKKEGTLRSHHINLDEDRRVDVYLYGLLKSEWQERQTA